MQVADLVLRYVQVIVWPALVATIVIVFRRQLGAALHGLTSLRFGALEASFRAVTAVASQEDLEPEERLTAIKRIIADAEAPTDDVRQRPPGSVPDDALQVVLDTLTAHLPEGWNFAGYGPRDKRYTEAQTFHLAQGAHLVQGFVLTDEEWRNGGMADLAERGRSLVIVVAGVGATGSLGADSQVLASSDVGSSAAVSQALSKLARPRPDMTSGRVPHIRH